MQGGIERVMYSALLFLTVTYSPVRALERWPVESALSYNPSTSSRKENEGTGVRWYRVARISTLALLHGTLFIAEAALQYIAGAVPKTGYFRYVDGWWDLACIIYCNSVATRNFSHRSRLPKLPGLFWKLFKPKSFCVEPSLPKKSNSPDFLFVTTSLGTYLPYIMVKV